MEDNAPEKNLESIRAERSMSLKEMYAQRALFGLIPGAIIIFVAVLMWVYPGPAGAGLRWVLTIFGPLAVAYGIHQLLESRKVEDHDVICPFCDHRNAFTEDPGNDVRCDSCNIQIPIVDGKILEVFQVQCGFCQHLNYYSDKSTGLVCENCDRVIPIATDEDPEAKEVLEHFTRKDDDNPYDLILISPGKHTDKMITILQRMLALNRKQIKEVIENAPITLFERVPRKKADLLSRQIIEAGGEAKFEISKDA